VNFVGGLTFLIAAPQKLNRGTSLKLATTWAGWGSASPVEITGGREF